MIFLILFILIVIPIIVFLVSVFKLNNFGLPSLSLESLLNNEKFKKGGKTNVLFVFPHPDDEVMSSGGLICKISKNNKFKTFVVSATKGEKGNELLKIPEKELVKVRENEFKSALKILGVKNYELWDFADGELNNQMQKLSVEIKTFIENNKIDWVITYEKGGLYGHKDHITLSKAVKELYVQQKNFKVLYAAFPTAVINRIKGKNFEIELENSVEHEKPALKVNILMQLYKKYSSAKVYKSQKLSHKLPLWFKIIQMPFEYYTEEKGE